MESRKAGILPCGVVLICLSDVNKVVAVHGEDTSDSGIGDQGRTAHDDDAAAAGGEETPLVRGQRSTHQQDGKSYCGSGKEIGKAVSGAVIECFAPYAEASFNAGYAAFSAAV